MFKVSSQRDRSCFQPRWNVDLCCSQNKAWTRLTLHNKKASSYDNLHCGHAVHTLMDDLNLSNVTVDVSSTIRHQLKCVMPCLPADMCKYTRRRVLLPCWCRKLTATSRCPKDNSDPTREGNQTLLSAENDLAECVLKNSSVYPQGLDFQWVLEEISYQI